MNWSDMLGVFEGITTLLQAAPAVLAGRIGLMLLGMTLVYLGKKGTLEPLLMIPMGMGMAAVNAGVLVLDPVTAASVTDGASAGGTVPGTLFMAPLTQQTESLMYVLQVDFLQPVYTFAFSNGLIACLVFMGIGVLLDVGFVIARPIQSMFLALCAELGTFAILPIGVALGLDYRESAAIAMVGGADGPMVLFTSLKLAPHLFVPITVVAYLYLGLTYGGYPWLIRLLVPARLRALRPQARAVLKVTSEEKLAFAVIGGTTLCLLFPSAAPLLLSLFVGVAVRESGLKVFVTLIDGTVLYGATFFLGLVLGVLCEASTLLDPKVLLLLLLGILALFLSGVGGILGGYALYLASGRRFNPVVGIAGVSCVPSTAKVAQKEVTHAAPEVIILPEALGANVCGVITSAIICGVYVSLVPLIK